MLTILGRNMTAILRLWPWSSFIHLFIQCYFCSASSSPLLLRGAPDTAQILCPSLTPKWHRQLRVKDLPEVPMSLLQNTTNLPMSHHTPQISNEWSSKTKLPAFFVRYSAKIINIDDRDKTVLIHFDGWNQRYDEWVKMDSDRLRPLTRHSDRRKKAEKRSPKTKPVGRSLFFQVCLWNWFVL